MLIEQLGSDGFVHVETADTGLQIVRIFESQLFESGQQVILTLRTHKYNLFDKQGSQLHHRTTQAI